MTAELIRPSSLPKLQACRVYVSKPGTSEAAERGTRLDEVIRRVWCDDDAAWCKVDSPEEVEAVNWAISTLKLLAAGEKVETSEAELRAVVPLEAIKAGTMDALCVTGGWLADFKSGQVRDYEAQMAAYALACMDAYFADEWATHLIFFDQKLVVSRSWQRAEAEAFLLGIINAPQTPTTCEYCGWCASFEECPAVRASASHVTAQELPALTKAEGALPPSVEGLLSDHAAAYEFLSKLKIVNDWAEVLTKRLRDQLTEAESPFFKRVVVSGSKKVAPSALAPYIEQLGPEKVLSLCSLLPLKKIEELWRDAYGDAPIPAELITSAGGSVQLRLTNKKNLPTK